MLPHSLIPLFLGHPVQHWNIFAFERMNVTGYWKEKSRFIENKLVAKYLLFHRKKVNNGPLYMVRIITAVILKVKV